jgi:hypothetical protein
MYSAKDTAYTDRAFIVACGCTYLGPEYDSRKWLGPSPYCGKPVVNDYSYCEQHVEQMYNKGTALRKRHADIRRATAQQELGSLFNDVVAELEADGELEL